MKLQNCRFCLNVPQTLMHMFSKCLYVKKKLWKTIWYVVAIFTEGNIDREMV